MTLLNSGVRKFINISKVLKPKTSSHFSSKVKVSCWDCTADMFFVLNQCYCVCHLHLPRCNIEPFFWVLSATVVRTLKSCDVVVMRLQPGTNRRSPLNMWFLAPRPLWKSMKTLCCQFFLEPKTWKVTTVVETIVNRYSRCCIGLITKESEIQTHLLEPLYQLPVVVPWYQITGFMMLSYLQLPEVSSCREMASGQVLPELLGTTCS